MNLEPEAVLQRRTQKIPARRFSVNTREPPTGRANCLQSGASQRDGQKRQHVPSSGPAAPALSMPPPGFTGGKAATAAAVPDHTATQPARPSAAPSPQPRRVTHRRVGRPYDSVYLHRASPAPAARPRRLSSASRSDPGQAMSH